MLLRSFSQAEIVLSHRQRFELSLLATTYVSICAFSLAEPSPFHLLAGTIAVGANALAAAKNREICVRRIFVNLAVLAATAIAIIELVVGKAGLMVTLGHYLILIQLCKLFERKRDRDYVQLLVMSGLLMVAAASNCDRVYFAAIALLYLILACHTGMIFTLKRCLDAAASAHPATATDPVQARMAAWRVIRDWPGRSLRRRLAVIIAAMLATGAVLFLLAPLRAWPAGAARDTRGSVPSGFGNYVRLGEANRIYESDEVMLTVTVASAPAGQMPAGGLLYLRGATFDVYKHSTWSSMPSTYSAFKYDAADANTIVLEVESDVSLLPKVFGVYPIVRCESPHAAAMFDGNLNAILPVHPTADGTVRYKTISWAGPLTERQREILRSRADTPASRPSGAPEATLRVRELAAQWCGDLLDRRAGLGEGPQRDEVDLLIAQSLARKLRDNYGYTLDLSACDPGRDAVEDFLFYMRQGHCEYFASAAAVMCRALGVNARVATGFCVEAPSRPGESFPVRARDAHAWAEVYTPSTHWVAIDATPPGRDEGRSRFWAALSSAWRKFQRFWNQNLMSYDRAARREARRWLSGAYHAVTGAIAHAYRALRQSFINLFTRGSIDMALVYLLVAAAVVDAAMLAALARRTRRRKLRKEKAAPPVQVRFFARLLALLKRSGVEIRQDLTAREQAAVAEARLNLPPGTIRELVEFYYAIRWGHATAPAEKIRAAEEQVSAIAGTLKR